MKKVLLFIAALLVVTGCSCGKKEKIEIDVSSNIGVTEWTDECQIISIAVTGTNTYEYSFDNGVTWQKSNTKQICENGKYILKVRNSSKDILATKTYEIKNIDATAPTIELESEYKFNTGSVVNLSSLIKTNDDGSGIASITCNPATINTSVEGSYAVNCEVIDYAENVANGTTTIIILTDSITLNKTNVSVKKGSTITLEATVTNAVTNAVTWSTSDKNIATVKDGIVTGLSAGTVTITAVTASGKTATCKVRVTTSGGSGSGGTTGVVVPTQIVLTAPQPIRMGVAVQMGYQVLPANAVNKTLTWSSSNPTVISVDSSGKITAKKDGIAVITATAFNGVSQSIQLAVLGD